LIFVHELGHFLVAKYFGVRVETFSLGFGKKIFKYKKGDTEYCISLFPLGGYVKMFGDDPTAEIPENEKQFAFNHKPVGQRIGVVLAGPLMNFFFAIVLFSLIALVGEETIQPKLGDVPQSSQAYTDGFRPGDTILKIDDQPVETWEQVQSQIEEKPDKNLKFLVQRDNSSDLEKITAKTTLVPNKNVLSSEDYVGGIDGLGFASSAATIGIISEDSAAYKAGLRTGDQIIAVDGKDVLRFKELATAIEASSGSNVSLKIQPEDPKKEPYSIEISKTKASPLELLTSFGIESSDLYVSKVVEDSAAAKAGMKEGDRIASINGHPVTSWQEIVSAIQSYKPEDKALTVAVQRNGKEVKFEVTPELMDQASSTGKNKKVYALGVVTAMSVAPPYTFVAKTSNPAKAIKIGAVKAVYWTKATVMSFVRLIQNKVSAKSIGGPIMIGQLASRTFEIGISPFMKIMAIISINLFVLNLLPVPILDGGHLVFYVIEVIKGAPLSMRKMEIAQQVGLVLLLALMVFAFVNDITRLLQ
jgi:regulator of sigma E protease